MSDPLEYSVAIEPTPLPTPKSSVVFFEVEDGAVLLSTEDEVYYGLNHVGARIWSLLPAESTLEGLCQRLHREYPEVAPEVLRSDVADLLADLLQSALLDPPDGGFRASEV